MRTLSVPSCCAFALVTHASAISVLKASQLPRIIWTFWQGQLPDVAVRCIETWKKFAPTWEIKVVDASSSIAILGTDVLPPNFADYGIQQRSDIIRAELLAKFGGLWLDATVALTERPETWIGRVESHNDLVGFELDFAGVHARDVHPLGASRWETFHKNGSLLTRPWEGKEALYFENWAFAAGKDCRAMKWWRDEFRRAQRTIGGFAEYCRQLRLLPDAHLFLHEHFQTWLPYLTMHAALAKVRHDNKNMHITTVRAEQTAFLHLDYAMDWDMARVTQQAKFWSDGTGGSIFALARGLHEIPGPPAVGPLMKIRALERQAFDSLVFYRGYAPDSPIARVFSLPPPPRYWPLRAMRKLAALEARYGPLTDDKILFCLCWALRFIVSALFYSISRPWTSSVVFVCVGALAYRRRAGRLRVIKAE